MYLTITRFALGPGLSHREVVRLFEQSLPRYAAIPGLLCKHYYLAEGDIAGGVYLWASKADAEALFTPEFAEAIRLRFGHAPTVQAMDCPITLDNLHATHRIERAPD
jgi:hypothetical protein